MALLQCRDVERLVMLSAMGGTTGWHYVITRNAPYAPHLPTMQRRRPGVNEVAPMRHEWQELAGLTVRGVNRA